MNDQTQLTPSSGRNPLLVLAGFALLGFALVFVVFGSSLFENAGNEPMANISGVETTANEGAQGSGFALPSGAIQVGDVAPNFVLADLEGNPVSLEVMRGRPVIVNFWATWCAPCRVEMPELQRAFEAYADQNLAIVAIDKDETPEAVSQFFYDEMSLTFTPVIDQNSIISDIYGAFNLPTSVFVNADGVVTAVHRGMMTYGQIEEYMEETLN